MEQSQQQVFRADIVMPQVTRLVYRQFNDAFRPGCKTYLTGTRLLAVPENKLHSGTYLAQAYAQIGEDLGGHSFLFSEQAE